MDSTTTATTILQGLEKQLADNKVRVEQRDLALKLEKIPEFRDLILREYMVEECARMINESTEPGLDRVLREELIGAAQAPGHLRRWLSARIQIGNTAEREIPRIEQAIHEEINTENEPEDDDDAEGIINGYLG